MDADGMVRVPCDTPGIGVTVDADFIQSLTTRSEELR
jgi:L-alanine-DL-glutamate epimerase-like enolase superfamily enzyme